MTDRYHYGPNGEYRGYSTTAGGGGGLLQIGIIVVVLWLVCIWIANFMQTPHPQPYQFIADVYRVVFDLAGVFPKAVARLDLTPYANLNLVLKLAVSVGLMAGAYFGIKAAAARFERKPAWVLRWGLLILSAPALLGVSWWTLAGVFGWLFARAA